MFFLTACKLGRKCIFFKGFEGFYACDLPDSQNRLYALNHRLMPLSTCDGCELIHLNPLPLIKIPNDQRHLQHDCLQLSLQMTRPSFCLTVLQFRQLYKFTNLYAREIENDFADSNTNFTISDRKLQYFDIKDRLNFLFISDHMLSSARSCQVYYYILNTPAILDILRV